jgi:hypothetical protein
LSLTPDLTHHTFEKTIGYDQKRYCKLFITSLWVLDTLEIDVFRTLQIPA